MERHIVTVDTGTTNTRAVLWEPQGRPAGVATAEVGVRDTAVDGHNNRLKAAVKDCLGRLLTEKGLDIPQVAAVYASGMITSNVGLAEIPHLVAPAGFDEFVRGVTTRELPEVFPLPFDFIPGLKNMPGPVGEADVEAMDIMRGEEAEVIALLSWLPKGEEYLFVLPGSHTKFVTVDADGRMTGCLTSLAGELLSLLTKQSILADAVGRAFVDSDGYRRERMLAGFRAAAATSFARAAFSTRILGQFVTKDPADCANFLLGAVLQNDVAAARTSRALRVSAGAKVVVAGKEPLRTALVDVFAADGFFRPPAAFTPPDGIIPSAYGAYLVAKARESDRL